MEEKRRFKKAYMIVLLGPVLVAALVLGCLEEQWEPNEQDNSQFYEACAAEDNETYRCKGETIELCRTGFWKPWEDCDNIGGTCEEDKYTGELYCFVPPPPPDAGDTDTDTSSDT